MTGINSCRDGSQRLASHKFRYVIFPDRVYTLDYDGEPFDVTGEEIIAAFRREAMLETIFRDWEDDGNKRED